MAARHQERHWIKIIQIQPEKITVIADQEEKVKSTLKSGSIFHPSNSVKPRNT